jgi:SAM-dependent methyltransferase
MSDKEYLLGASQMEFDRLQFQHGVWRPMTNAFFDRIGVASGWHCLDVGAGPGFVSFDLCDRVGGSGSVTALEPSPLYHDWFAREVLSRGARNIQTIRATVNEATLPHEKYDLIFARWVIGFVADAEQFIRTLLPSLKPGGVIAFQDYYYEALSLYPRGGPFDKMADAVRAYWRSDGGDPYVTGSIPAWLRKHNVVVTDFTPHVHAGGPESDLIEWAHRFFTMHIQHMVEKNVLSQQSGDAMLADWLAHRKNPDTIFFSPIVVDVAGRK